MKKLLDKEQRRFKKEFDRPIWDIQKKHHLDVRPQLKSFLKQSNKRVMEEERERVISYIEQLAIEECDSFELVGIHRCSYGHCERCGICDILSDLLIKLQSLKNTTNHD